ncbi:unnamed protein product [Malus baccata var. baccata]
MQQSNSLLQYYQVMDTKILLCSGVSCILRFLLCLTFIACMSMASVTISPGQSLSGSQTITSPGGKFELGFFTPGNSRNYYIGIWYKNLANRIVVWVANRQQPVSEPKLSVLELVENGNLTLTSPSKVAIYAKLLDNGNFVITDAFNSSVVLWQSFDYLTNTWLLGAELGYNNRTKRKQVLTPWRNSKNPALGPFSFELDEIPLPYSISSYPDTFTRGTIEINGQLKHHSRVLTTMRGTVGYLAPEWFSGEAITPKADVFSYGMLLIEVISGRRNMEGLDNGVENFRPLWLANAVNKGEDLFAVLDCRLEGQADGDELSRVCKVACWCIQEDEKDRPTMRQVVQILEGVSDIGTSPVPQFLQRLIKFPAEGINYQETTSGSGPWTTSIDFKSQEPK